MRVLHLVKTGVGAAWAVRQVRELVSLGVDVHVAVPPGPRGADYLAAGATVHPVAIAVVLSQPLETARRLALLRALVSEVRPDVIHSHFVATTLAMRLALRSDARPRLFQVPGPLHMENAVTRWLDLATATRADAWMASCAWVRSRYIRSGVPKDRVSLSYYGVDIDAFGAVSPAPLRRDLDLGNGPLVGMVAHIYAPRPLLGQSRGLKGHEDLIDAMALLRRRVPEACCVIAGGPWEGAARYAGRLHDYAARRCPDGIRFLGHRDDVLGVYAAMDVAVHPSLSENVGGAVESLLMGVPTVATNVGGLPDLVRPGETGWLVPPKNPSALADALEEALADPGHGRAMAASGCALARHLFDVRRTASEVLGVYERLIERPAVAEVSA